MLTARVFEIPENYSNTEMEPRVFDAIPDSEERRKLAGDAGTAAPKNMQELYDFSATLTKETLAKLQQEAAKTYAELEPADREATTVGAINIRLLLREKQVQKLRSEMAAVSAAAATNRVTKRSEDRTMTNVATTSPTSGVRRVVRKKPAVNPMANLEIDGLSAEPKEPTTTLTIVWNDPQNPDEQYVYSADYHWVQLICEGNNVVQILAVRDKRYPALYDAPKVPFSAALPATLTITDNGVDDVFGVMSGVFQFEFGVFDFCLFLVIN
jgi:hypothetical protein